MSGGTKMENVNIRVASPDDAEKLLEIYAPYVEKTAITFEYDVPTVHEFKKRIENTLERYPYLVAEVGDKIVGYAYTGSFVGRAAYDYSAETSIYIDEGCRNKGIGKRLYAAIEEISVAQNVINLYACIGYPEVEDEHLTMNSVDFHEHLGYKTVGRFEKCGRKFDTWYDMVWMEKMIGEHDEDVKMFVPFPELIL